jgi:5'-3' exonuclease
MTAVAASVSRQEILLIDLSHLFRSAWAIAESSQDYSGVFQQTLDGVRRCIGQRDALVGVCCDGRGSWRKELQPDYKANREAKPASMYDTLRLVKERLTNDGLLLWEVDTFEADDVIATAARAAMRAGHERITIASNDKDLLQLMNDEGVRYLKTSTWDELDAAHALEKLAVRPEQVVDYLALVGDASDNVKGVPGVGAKRAAELLAKWESWSGILDQMAIDASKVATPAVAKALAENVEAVELGRKLIQLRADVPIKFEEIYEVRKQKPIAKGIPPMPEKKQVDFDDARISAPVVDAAPLEAVTPQEPTPTTVPANETSLAPLVKAEVMPASFDMQLEPQSLGQAERMGSVLQNSRLYPKLANDAAIFAVIVRGRELGLGALVSLDVFSVVEGRLCPSSHFVISKAKADPDCEFFQCIESTDKVATWETKNRKNPKPTRLSYTIEQAQKAGLIKERGNWATRPAEMLRKTAGVQLARMEYPAASLGLYSDEEMEGAA